MFNSKAKWRCQDHDKKQVNKLKFNCAKLALVLLSSIWLDPSLFIFPVFSYIKGVHPRRAIIKSKTLFSSRYFYFNFHFLQTFCKTAFHFPRVSFSCNTLVSSISSGVMSLENLFFFIFVLLMSFLTQNFTRSSTLIWETY